MAILLLTARDVSEGIVRGLDADDYLTKPEVSFSELVREMVESDLDLAKRDSLVEKEGYKVYKHHE